MMDATLNIATVGLGTNSSIMTTGILPSYYDSAPSIVITETTSFKLPSKYVVPATDIFPADEPDEEQ